MKKNRMGSSELFVSEIGLGTMSLPKDEKMALMLIDEAMDRGVNFFDTADLYGQGAIESLLGKALKGKRDKVIIATKGGNHWEAGQEGWFWDPSKEYIKAACKESLRRLKTDYIDLYQLHGGTASDPIDETIEAFEELKKEGYIRYYGISSIRPNVIRRYIKRASISSVMMQYSILDRRPEEEVLDLLHAAHISVIVRGPVAKGILSDQGLHKISAKGFLDYTAEELRSIVAAIQEQMCQNRPLSQTAIRYSLTHPAVAAVIPGASRLDQLIRNIETGNSPALSRNEINFLREVSHANQYDNHR